MHTFHDWPQPGVHPCRRHLRTTHQRWGRGECCASKLSAMMAQLSVHCARLLLPLAGDWLVLKCVKRAVALA
jgi:hypothetical protein